MSSRGAEEALGRRRLPVIRAAEAAECGLACLAMVAGYHGMEVGLNNLRQLFPTSMAGMSLRGVMTIADRLDLATRACRVELAELAEVQTPAILHWDHKHFVVLKAFETRGAVIHDPARGEVRLSLAELDAHFNGVLLELAPTPAFKPVKAGEKLSISHLWSDVSGAGPAVAVILGLSLALQFASFALPFQIQLTVDEAILKGDRSLLFVLAMAFCSLVALQAGLEVLRGWVLQVVSYNGLYQVTANLVRHMIRLPLGWFESRTVGDILSRLGSTAAIQDTLTRGVVGAILDGVTALIAGLILVAYAPTLALVVAVGVAFNLLLTCATYPLVAERMRERIAASAREQTHLMETVRAAATIKVAGREAEREADWRGLYAKFATSLMDLAKLRIGVAGAQTLVNGLQGVAVVYCGARLVIDNQGFSIGMLMAFLAFRQIFSDRLTTFINQALEFKLLDVHLDRLSDIVETPREHLSQNTPPRFQVEGAIVLKDVGFQYGATDRAILTGVNLAIRPGDYVAITGPSGGGKTTLLKLILGLNAPSHGALELDGMPATAELSRIWREKVGYVSQDDRLLSGSIGDNIAFFDPDMDMAEVERCARLAGVHEDIARMPMRYATLVGDMGSSLSGGQRQRVFLARALYRQPSILCLDEGTANLDLETEAAIARMVRDMAITRIVVAHRPALLKDAARVFVVEDGRVEEAMMAPKQELDPTPV